MAIRIPALDDQYTRQLFFDRQRPVFWWQKAREMAEAGEVLRRNTKKLQKDQAAGRRFRRKIMPGLWTSAWNPPSYETSNFLYALAIENALKGILIGRNNDLISDGKMSKTITGTFHDLRKISELAEIEMSDTELSLLDKLTETIKWSGRYPTPRHQDEMLPRQNTGKRRHPGVSYWGSDRDDTSVLFRKLDALLSTLLQDKYSEPLWIE